MTEGGNNTSNSTTSSDRKSTNGMLDWRYPRHWKMKRVPRCRLFSLVDVHDMILAPRDCWQAWANVDGRLALKVKDGAGSFSIHLFNNIHNQFFNNALVAVVVVVLVMAAVAVVRQRRVV